MKYIKNVFLIDVERLSCGMDATDYIGLEIDGKYQIIQLLGCGGMGSVYLATHNILGRQVAIKILHPQYAKKKSLVTRFCREAQAAIEINHPNVADVLDIGQLPNGTPYMMMEYLKGEPLSLLLKRKGPIQLGAACRIFEHVLMALDGAHQKGIVHRDLKPENIYVVYDDQGVPTVKLIDFGISKFTDHQELTNLTKSGDLLGTPAYMSPEQVRGENQLDAQSDLFSFGVIAFEILTGKRPFGGFQYHEIISAVLSKEAPSPLSVYSKFPREAEPFVLKLLHKKAKDRYASAAETLEAVQQFSAFYDRKSLFKICCAGFMETTRTSSQTESENSDEAVEKKFQSSRDICSRSVTTTFVNKSKTRIALLSAVVAVLILVVGVLVFLLSSKDPQFNKEKPQKVTSHITTKKTDTPALKQTATSFVSPIPQKNDRSPLEVPNASTPTSIRIKLMGVPDGANIQYNNVSTHGNIFAVEKSNNSLPLSVFAKGYKPFKTMIVPTKALTVKVQMEPVANENMTPQTPTEQTTVSTATPLPNVSKSQKEKQASRKKSKRRAAKQPIKKQDMFGPDGKAVKSDLF